MNVFSYQVHFKPFLFEAFLSHRVKESSSRCTISNGEVEFHLEKEEKNVQWDTLCVDLSREEKNKAREEILVNVIDRNQQNKIAKQGAEYVTMSYINFKVFPFSIN